MRTLKEVTVEVIQKCNSSCIFCSSLSHPFAQNEIPLGKLVDIFKFAKEKGAVTINLSGGEPLLRKDIAKIIELLSEMELKTNLYTSGNIHNTKIVDEILQKNIPTDKLTFIFNYPAYNNDTYQYLIDSKEMNITTLDNAIRMIVQKGYPVETHIIPHALNIDDLYDSILHLKRLSVTRVSLLRIVYQGRAEFNKQKLFLTPGKMVVLEETIQKIKSELCDASFTLRVGIPFKSLVRQKCECFAGFAKLIFRYDGIVFPCEAFKEAPQNNQYILGNIYTDSLDHIWENHPVHNRLRLLKKAAAKAEEDCPAQLLYK
jgi:pyrroloquinoline quinone biosynthesis protein E